MPYDETMRKVKYDLQRGEMDRAKQRLTGMLRAYAGDLEIRRMLGDIHFQQGNIIEAGRYWYLEEHKTPEMQAACERFEKACGNKPDTILRKIRFQGRTYPINMLKREHPYAAQLLTELAREAFADYRVTIPDGYWFIDKRIPKIYTNAPYYDHDLMEHGHILMVDSNGLLTRTAYDHKIQSECITSLTDDNTLSLSDKENFFSYTVSFAEFEEIQKIILDAVIKRGRFYRAIVWLPLDTPFSIHKLLSNYVDYTYTVILPLTVVDEKSVLENKIRQAKFLDTLIPAGYQEAVIGFSYQNGVSRWFTLEELKNKLALIGHIGKFIGTVDPSVPRPDEPIPSYYLA